MADINLNDLLKNARDSHMVEDRINDKVEFEVIKFFRESIGMDEADYKAISFVSMLIYYCEKNIEKMCIYFIKRGVITPQSNKMVDCIFEELTFSAKINFYEKLLKKYFPERKDLKTGVSYYRKLNAIRNDIFHCRLKDVGYEKKPITEYKTRKLMLEDMIKSCGIEIDQNQKSNREMAAQTYKVKNLK